MTKAGERIRDLREPTRRFALWIRRDIVEKSRAGHDVSGGSFPALSENTVAAKRFFGLSPAPLIATGEMLRERTLRYRIKKTSGRVWVPRSVEAAYWAQYGTRAHIIAVRNARFLRFYTKNGWQFKKQVQHPGTPPREWFGPRPGSTKVLGRIVQAWLKRAIATRGRAA